MAEFRNIHTRIWKDEWFSELEPDAKLLFVYLFSNERASVCGMYELPLKFIIFESGLDKQRVTQILKQFEDAGKAYYRDGVVWVVNLRKYNDSGNSPKVFARIVKDIEGIPDGELKEMYCKYHKIPYRYPTDRVSEKSPDTETETDTDTETETETPVDTSYPLAPEIELYREITGLVPDYMRLDEVKRNILSVHMRLKYPPRQQLKEYLEGKYKLWCSCATEEGKPYNPSNPKWLEWGITNYTPKLPANNSANGHNGKPAAEVWQ